MKSKSSKQTLSFALIAALFLWAGTGLLPLSRSSADTTLVAYAAGGKDSETSAALQAAKQEQLNNTEIRSFDGEKTYTNSLLNPESKYIFNGEGSAQPSYEADNTENAENAEKDATAIQPKTGYADPSGKTAKDYSYEIVPLLAPFNEYFLVKTENPDPTSFRFKDKKSIYCNENDNVYYTNKSLIVLDEDLFADVVYENTETKRVNGGYIFYSSDTDGGKVALEISTGRYSWEDTGVNVTMPKVMDDADYLIKTYAKGNSFFDKMDAVQKGFDSICLYSGASIRGEIYQSDPYWRIQTGHVDQSFYLVSWILENVTIIS